MKYVKYGHGKWRKTNYLIFDKNGIGFVDLLRNEKYVYGIIDKEGNSGIKKVPLGAKHG